MADRVAPGAEAEAPPTPQPRSFTFEAPPEDESVRGLTFELKPTAPPPGPEGRVARPWSSAADHLAISTALLAAPREADVVEGTTHMIQLTADPARMMEMMIRSAIVRAVGFRVRAMELARIGDRIDDPRRRDATHRAAIYHVREVRAEEDRVLRLLAKRERYVRDHRWESNEPPPDPASAERLNEEMDHVTAAAMAAFNRARPRGAPARGKSKPKD